MPSFAQIAPRYDALRPLSPGDRERLERMVSAAPLKPEDLILEVGCGTGRLTMPLAAITPARVVGIDAEARMLEVARQKDPDGRVDWQRGSAYRLPIADETAAMTLMVMVVHLLRQRRRAFGEARRVLRPGGRLVVWTFTPRHVKEFYLNEYFPSIESIDGPRFPDAPVLAEELRRSGFVDVAIDVMEDVRSMTIGEVVDRVRGRYISTLTLVSPLEYRLGLQRLEEMLAIDPTATFRQRSEWLVLTATRR
jgi:SAM-dependent methyltransferase